MSSLLESFTALYTPLDIEYAQAMSGKYDEFVTFDGYSCACVVALKDDRITGYWRPVVCFGPIEYQQKRIEELWAISQDIYYQDFLIDGNLSPVSRFLLARGYRAELYYTQVIDLTQSVDMLRHDLRKSYHSLVNKDERVEFCDVSTFQGIHEYVKQKRRSQESWDIQKKMETICCHDNGRCGVMFYVGPVWAYYASAAGEDTHACVWSCLMELKQRGVHWCEMGEQVFSGPNEKLVNISRFKAGFSGETRVRLLLKKT